MQVKNNFNIWNAIYLFYIINGRTLIAFTFLFCRPLTDTMGIYWHKLQSFPKIARVYYSWNLYRTTSFVRNLTKCIILKFPNYCKTLWRETLKHIQLYNKYIRINSVVTIYLSNLLRQLSRPPFIPLWFNLRCSQTSHFKEKSSDTIL